MSGALAGAAPVNEAPDGPLRWMRLGTARFLDACAALDEAAFDAHTPLPGWTRRHLAAHVAGNADALGNLVRWAATGEPTPMYTSADERRAGIERGATMTGAELVNRLTRSATDLAVGLDALTPDRWTYEVVTAQGRVLPAREIPWLRAREVCVHTVDLAVGIGFDAFPQDFLKRLTTEAAGKHRAGSGPTVDLTATDIDHTWRLAGHGEPVVVRAPLADITAYLTGRVAVLPTESGKPAPALGAWL
ncbi:maleylpyruvate isomerase family mycothiol-dependent enzyme [Embleya sp. NPDC050493]|uniref:maleylpyruvate isomerase family mycothiol-dependent enzyme n=1 Tax=Embleya sp. NPDC050493 TaxID=3363989 RepID=UPI00378D5E00